MTPRDHAEWRRLLAGQRLPCVVVDLDAFDRNVAALTRLVRPSGKSVRLATKSVRVPELIQRVLSSGEPYRGLMCFCAEEAALLRGHGLDDLLVAYPTTHRSDLTLLRKLHDAGCRVMLVVDGSEGIRALAEVMRGAAQAFPVVVELDASLRLAGGALHLGVRRSPVRGVDALMHLVDEIQATRVLRPVGVMAYEAQVAGLGDRNPFKRALNPVASAVRKASARAVASLRREVAAAWKQRGLTLEVFNGAGTGSVTFAVGEDALTEVTAGSGLLCSHLFDYYSNVRFEPACFFALQVVRVSDDGYATCQGGGYVASGEPGWDKVPRPWVPAGVELVTTEGCGEVQTPLRLPTGTRLQPGDPVLFRHAKAGELAERFNAYLLVQGGKIVGSAQTYRGMGACFP
ncbi:MAG: alanine racemase [Myxococcota bacterium]